MVRLLLPLSVLLLVACGGGGGGGDDDVGPFNPLRTIAVTVRAGAAPATDSRLELTTIDGLPSVNVQPAGFDTVGGPTWSPAHHRVAFLAIDSVTEFARLYVADPVTLVALEVSEGIPAAARVWEFEWSPQSDRLVFTASEPGGSNRGWIVNDDGTGLAQRFFPFNGNSSEGIEEPRWSPDGLSVAFLDASVDLDSPSLWLGDAATGFAFTLASPDDGTLAGVDTFEWSPDGLRIALIGELETAGAQEAFVVPSSGAGPLARLHDPLAAGRGVSYLEWAPNGSRVALIGDLLVDGRSEVFTCLPTGGSATPINGALVAGGEAQEFFWAPNSLLLAYLADQATDDLVQLYVRSADGSGAALEISPGVQGSVEEVAWSPNSALLAYAAGPGLASGGVYVRPPAPVPGLRVSVTSLTTPGGVGRIEWSPLSDRLAYNAGHVLADRMDCFVATLAAASAVRITDFSGPAGSESRSSVFGFDDAGARVYYSQNDDATNQSFLFSDLGDGDSRRTHAGPFPYTLLNGVQRAVLR